MSGPVQVGIPQLDALLGSVPQNASILYVNDPGVETDAFLLQSAAHHLSTGRKVVYVTLRRSPSAILDSMAEYGFDARGGGSRLLFVDGFSSTRAGFEEAAYVLRHPDDLDELVHLVDQAASEHPDAVILFDALNDLADRWGTPGFSEAAAKIAKAIKRFHLAEALFTEWEYEGTIKHVYQHFDAILRLRTVQGRIQLTQYFLVERANWLAQTPATPRLYRALKPGGVQVYIPKILVTGPPNAGKSTFIQSVSDTAHSVDRMGTTIALDHGQYTQDGLTADLFGTPGQSRFDPLLQRLGGHALGVIVMVDASRPETFGRAKEMLDQTWKEGLPALIVANKSDLGNALSIDSLAAELKPPGGVDVVSCVASDRDRARAVLREMIDRILAGGMKF